MVNMQNALLLGHGRYKELGSLRAANVLGAPLWSAARFDSEAGLEDAYSRKTRNIIGRVKSHLSRSIFSSA